MNVQFTEVTPGIALGANEAKRLRKEIAALLEGMLSPGRGTALHIPNFKLDNGQKRSVDFKVLSQHGDVCEVKLISMA